MSRFSAVSFAVALALTAAMTLGSAGVSQAADNRADCGAIRGTDYLSDEERAWFLTYCVGGISTLAPAPPVVQVQFPPLAPPPSPVRPTAPSVRVTCSSSFGTATAAENVQQAPLSAFAGEPIACTVAISGAYTSIDWDAGSLDGHATTFVSSFDFSRFPQSVRLQVNWGGNPVIKFINITTLGLACLPQYVYQVCIP